MTKPRLFIGSASESLPIVKSLELELHDDVNIDRWDLDVFRPGHFTLEELVSEAKGVDFAVFVLGREDVTHSHEKMVSSPRDNVVFEAGLFTAVLGRQRTFYVVDSQGTKLPTDWAGLGYLTFDGAAERARDKVFKAAAAIRKQIESLGALNRTGVSTIIAGHWWQSVLSTDDGAVLSLLEIQAPASTSEAFKLQGASWSKDGKRYAQYRSRSAQFDSASRTLSYYWDGEHPRDGSCPHYFGIGEITFGLSGEGPQTATGFYSTSNRTELAGTRLKSTEYVRATSEEVRTLASPLAHERAAVVQARLHERSERD